MNYPEIHLTENEWNALGNAGIKPETLDDHSFKDILNALEPDLNREKQLREMFFGGISSPVLHNSAYDVVQKLTWNPAHQISEMFIQAASNPIAAISTAFTVNDALQVAAKPA